MFPRIGQTTFRLSLDKQVAGRIIDESQAQDHIYYGFLEVGFILELEQRYRCSL
jgi:hypothetical protein